MLGGNADFGVDPRFFCGAEDRAILMTSGRVPKTAKNSMSVPISVGTDHRLGRDVGEHLPVVCSTMRSHAGSRTFRALARGIRPRLRIRLPQELCWATPASASSRAAFETTHLRHALYSTTLIWKAKSVPGLSPAQHPHVDGITVLGDFRGRDILWR